MSGLVQIGAPGGDAAPSFARPFEMLEACHERVHRTLRLLQVLREHLRARSADELARSAAADVMRYFDLAAPQHHLDEELHVFPVLLAAGDARLRDVVLGLQDGHRRMAAAWPAARSVLEALTQGRLQALDDAHAAALDAWSRLYDAHIHDEEALAYPAAQALLDGDRLREMGGEMARRRGARSAPG